VPREHAARAKLALAALDAPPPAADLDAEGED
jgi:hypothetical protein